jgi:beta-galactosidase
MMNRRRFFASSTLASGVVAAAWLGRAGPLLAAPPLPAAAPLSPDMPVPLGHLPATAAPADPSLHRLDEGWHFHEGDLPFPSVRGNDETYAATKSGNAQGAAGWDYDDSAWATVRVPHDWAISHPIEPDQNNAFAFRRRGIGWYRRTLRLPPEWHGRFLELQLGGMATLATVWVNGVEVAHSHSGYVQANIDITPYARFGDEPNTIAIRVDAEAMEGWWYDGAGLYRDCWLAVRSPLHIATDGIWADPRQGQDGAWHVPVVATLESSAETPATATLEAVLLDPDGAVLARGRQAARVAPLGRGEARVTLPVPAPRLWHPDSPVLHTLETRLLADDGTLLDSRRTAIGFRTIRFDPATGFHINGHPLKIKGVCIHQDHIGVGVAMPEALWEWKVRRLKDIGCNAIRSTHHAPNPALLDACDRLGVLVMDENRHFNPSPDYLAQLAWMVRRDRNRPSVIMWSVLNEEPMQGTEQGYEMVRRLAAAVRALDDSRPVTAAMNDGMFTARNGADAVDLVGFNYKAEWYDRYHALHPDRPLTSTEDTSAVMTRGEWRTDTERNVLSSYDTEAPEWGLTHHESWRMIGSRPFIAATFVWTGFDYHGEPTPLPWPAASSSFGILDICGFGKMAYHLRRAQWRAEPVLALAPHWDWPGQEGKPVRVMALTNVERVELRLNGVMVGSQPVAGYAIPEWQVPYAPGRLEAIGFIGGKAVVHSLVETTGAPVQLRLTPDRPLMLGTGRDVQPVSIDLLDAAGRHSPTATDRVTLSIEGGEIIGLGNGDPNDHDPEQGHSRKLFAGLAQVLIRAPQGPGELVLTAKVGGLPPARLAIRVVAAQDGPRIAATPAAQPLTEWRRAGFTATAPDAARVYPAGDWRRLAYVRPGRLEEAQAAASFTLMQSHYTPRAPVALHGGRLAFAGIAGRAQLWVDGRLVARKDTAEDGPLQAELAPGEQTRILTLALEAPAGHAVGLSKGVTVWASA